MSPVAYATVTRDLLATLQASEDVADIDLDDDNTGASLSVATQVINAVPGVHDQLGFVAQNEMIGQVEFGTSNYQIAAHSCLDQITQPPGSVPTLVNPHATAVAGVMVCYSDGIAHGANVKLGIGSTQSSYETAASSVRTWGARALNMSYWLGSGLTVNTHDKFYDDMFTTYFVTAVVAAGNNGNCTTGAAGDVAHPALAYNVITVGNEDDKNTVGRSDDTMFCDSSSIDPISANSDREKPEVAAPGTSIDLPNTSGGFSPQTGTSFAAPMVTGTAALMMGANNQMRTWPEVVKAAIMVTATTNIEGDQRLSDLDGAGGINARRAVDVVRANGPSNSDWQGVSASCSSLPLNFTMNLTAGKRARVAIVWHQDSSYADYTLRASADLDLAMYDPSNAWVVDSSSFDNTYEIVDFVPSTTGQYRAYVDSPRCTKSPKYIGLAWYQVP